MKDPIGLLGSEIPTLERRIALETRLIASSWPTTLFFNSSSICINFSVSPSIKRPTGILVHLATIWAISSSVISSFSIRELCCREAIFLLLSSSSFSNSGNLPYFISAKRFRSPLLSACSASVLTLSISLLIWLIFWIISFSWFHLSINSFFSSSRLLRLFSIFFIFSRARAVLSFFRACLSIWSCIIFLWISSISMGILSISIRSPEAASSIKSIALSGKKRSVI